MIKKIVLLLVIFLGLLACRDLFRPGYYPMHDDLQVARIYQMDKCLKDGQIPCRWVPDMGYGYGYPLYNFYPPLPFYLGEIVHLSGFSYIDSVKFIFILGMVLSGVFMYLLAKEFWGKLGGLVSATFYIWAPYHAVNLYVRGAMNEYWAITFFPLIFWAIYKIIKNGKKYIPLLAISFTGLLLSHNIMSMLFAPLMGAWAIFLILWEKKKIFSFDKNDFKKIKNLTLGVFWGVGLSLFFILPALVEKSLIHVETMFMGYFNYLAHFVSISQLFLSRFWGYGASVWGPGDEMPFQIGFLHWGVGLLVLGLFLRLWIKKKDRRFFMVTFFMTIFLTASFLAHSRSGLFWKIISPLEYLQFPWRFLALVIFSLSFVCGGLLSFVKGARRQFLSALLIVGVVVLSFNYFKIEKVIDIRDQEKIFSEKGRQRIYTDAIFDYLPKYAPMPPTSPAPDFVIDRNSLEEIGMIKLEKGSNWRRFYSNFEKDREIIIPQYYFPGWKVWIDEKQADIGYEDDLGRIVISVPSGEHEIYLRLTNTPVRTWANLISLISWWGLLTLLVGPKLWRLIQNK